jgi:hypothetical protein
MDGVDLLAVATGAATAAGVYTAFQVVTALVSRLRGDRISLDWRFDPLV